MRRALLLSLVLACETPPPPAPEVAEASPMERVQGLRNALQGAQRAWTEGRRQEARSRSRSAYFEAFQPLVPALRGVDAMATLQLEYAFGDLERRLGRSNDAVGVSELVQRITRGTDALASTLPQPVGQEATPSVQAGAPVTEEATLPTHLVAEPRPVKAD